MEAAGRIALSRVAAAFEAALRDLTDQAADRLRQLDRGVEQSLLANLAAATGITTKVAPATATAETDRLDETDDDGLLGDAVALVIAAGSGRAVTTAEQARAEADLLLHFPDGVVPARVAHPEITHSATTH